MNKKIIAITGATGAQGGGLARAILNDKNSPFTVRAITRDTNSEKAKALAKMGAEIFKADLDDKSSLKRAFEGAYGAFCVTFYWAHLSPEKELQQALTIAEVAKKNNLKHVIWSTLEDTRQWIPRNDNRMPTLMKKYKVPHYDAKGEANAFFTNAGVPTTFFLTSFYWENFIYFGMNPKPGYNGKLAITIPMGNKKLPSIAAEDIGKCAYGIFKKGNALIGKTVGIAGGHLTGHQIATALSKGLGKEIVYNDVSPATYRSFGFPGADDLGNMFQFKHDFEEYYCGARNIDITRSLNPDLQTFERWVAENKNRIPLE